jgi:hypothetical protein
MAITNFIPTVWSEVLREELSRKYVGVANCSRDFEGDIKEMGSKVKICGVNPVSLFNYVKNNNLTGPEVLSDNSVDIMISQARAFNFLVDDIDRAQAHPNLMKAAMRSAAEAIANDADVFVFANYSDVPAENYVKDGNATYETILDDIIKGREILFGSGVTESSDVVLEVSPAVASLILKAKIMYGTSDNHKALENGYLGSICGCDVYVSHNIEYDAGENEKVYKCFMRTKRAVAFVNQLTEIEAYRPENRFADAVKGLHLYGSQIIYPNEMVILEISVHG